MELATLAALRRALVRQSRLILGLLLTALVWAPTSSGAKPQPPPVPQLDTATAIGDNVVTDDFSSSNIHVDAYSGPSGEHPGGSVSFDAGVERLPISGPVTCLNITGNTAVMTVTGPFPSRPGFTGFIVKLVDNGGSGLDRFEFFPLFPEIPVHLDCRTGSPVYFGGALIGRAVVVDAPPLPASKDQCKNGGYAHFGFRNQGECIKGVAA